MYGEVTLQFGWATHTCVYIYRSIHNMLCTQGFWGKVMDIDVAIALGHTHIYMLHIICVHRDYVCTQGFWGKLRGSNVAIPLGHTYTYIDIYMYA